MTVSAFILVLALPLAIILSSWLLIRWRFPLSGLPYPPGPPISSLVSGNFKEVPQEQSWLTYIEWGKKYTTDLVHFRMYNQHMVIINSLEDSIELLERRSNTYSDRPHTTMIDLMGFDFVTGFKPYGVEWRIHRRLWQHLFKPEVALKYQPIQTRKMNDFLYSLLSTPDNFMNHYRTLAAAIIMSTMYGHDITPKGDYYVELAEAALSKLALSVFPGAVAVNTLPILRFLPSWFPGAGFKRFSSEVAELVRQMREVPIDSLKKQIEAGKAPSCCAADLLESNPSKEELEVIVSVVSSAYAAGADTVVSSMGTFFLAMAKFPDVQEKAQKEIDEIVGQDRLVNYDDRVSLPYIEALHREVLRWRPVTPLGLAHATSEDDVYKGQYIPKGTIVMANIWAIAHNPTTYPEPDVFDPSRFFNKDGELNEDELLYAFGFGRRMCPGRHMASATLWLTIASVLQNFNLKYKKDATGSDIPISGDYSDGLMIHALPYECSITPRHDTSTRIILQGTGNANY